MNHDQDVHHMLARYMRAAGKRGGMAMTALLVDDACIEIYEG